MMASKSQTRQCMSKAMEILRAARQNQYFCCDVCGPYGHYMHLCYSACTSAFECLLTFQGRKFERYTELRSLAAAAFDDAAELERCLDAVTRFSKLPTFDPGDLDMEPPTQAQREEAFRVANEIITSIISALPESVRPQ